MGRNYTDAEAIPLYGGFASIQIGTNERFEFSGFHWIFDVSSSVVVSRRKRTDFERIFDRFKEERLPYCEILNRICVVSAR